MSSLLEHLELNKKSPEKSNAQGPINTVPNELVISILELLPSDYPRRGGLCSMTLVNKKFNAIATPILYRRVVVHHSHEDGMRVGQKRSLFRFPVEKAKLVREIEVLGDINATHHHEILNLTAMDIGVTMHPSKRLWDVTCLVVQCLLAKIQKTHYIKKFVLDLEFCDASIGDCSLAHHQTQYLSITAGCIGAKAIEYMMNVQPADRTFVAAGLYKSLNDSYFKHMEVKKLSAYVFPFEGVPLLTGLIFNNLDHLESLTIHAEPHRGALANPMVEILKQVKEKSVASSEQQQAKLPRLKELVLLDFHGTPDATSEYETMIPFEQLRSLKLASGVSPFSLRNNPPALSHLATLALCNMNLETAESILSGLHSPVRHLDIRIRTSKPEYFHAGLRAFPVEEYILRHKESMQFLWIQSVVDGADKFLPDECLVQMNLESLKHLHQLKYLVLAADNDYFEEQHKAGNRKEPTIERLVYETRKGPDEKNEEDREDLDIFLPYAIDLPNVIELRLVRGYPEIKHFLDPAERKWRWTDDPIYHVPPPGLHQVWWDFLGSHFDRYGEDLKLKVFSVSSPLGEERVYKISAGGKESDEDEMTVEVDEITKEERAEIFYQSSDLQTISKRGFGVDILR